MDLMEHFQAISLGLMDNLIMFITLIIGVFEASGDIKLVIIAGVIGGIANSFSNSIGYYTSESAEIGQQKEFYKNKKTNGDEKYIHTHKEIIVGSIFTFCASISALILPLLPILLIQDIGLALAGSITIAMAMLAVMGYYIAKLNNYSKLQTMIKYITLAIIGAIFGFVLGKTLEAIILIK